MTEDEAMTKWCPFGRGPLDDQGVMVGNRVADKHYGRCIASACMAWRWDTRPIEGRPGSEEAVQIGNRMHVERIPEIVAVTGLGHCGLAGSGS